MRADLNKTTTEWFVYIIRSSDDSLYTGITTDIQRRWNEHCGTVKGAKYFRGRKPQELLFITTEADRSSATKLEMSIKKYKREDKLKLVDSVQNQISQYQLNLKSNSLESR